MPSQPASDSRENDRTAPLDAMHASRQPASGCRRRRSPRSGQPEILTPCPHGHAPGQVTGQHEAGRYNRSQFNNYEPEDGRIEQPVDACPLAEQQCPPREKAQPSTIAEDPHGDRLSSEEEI
ncbi:hypothetical protein DPEC_G00134820 [Dallia pectoralis]|uniref:Uncharacterized protein n=1 Tax=Dallia pectoralis TaxID=75939 RepID=A0ACC2GRY2_DALPE|nr:hypothetical protein DPEC_G00134820 [Dallia pectoralis]